MAKKFEERVEEVRAAVRGPGEPQSRKCLLRALRGKQGYLISLAAAAICPSDHALVDEARDAFERLMSDATKRDPQCHGKVAIAQALYDADIASDALFLRGVAHVQLEPIMGGRQDTAAQLRGISLMALVHAQHPRALVSAATLLADPERAARLAALRALSASGRSDIAEPLLRLRLACGDEDPEVISECMSALLEINGPDNLAVVGAWAAARDPTTAQAAALAIGTSRLPGAFELLSTLVEETVLPGPRRTLLLALAMVRSDPAWQHLIELVMDGTLGQAVDAIAALATFKDQDGLRQRVEAAATDRSEREIHRAFSEGFGGRSK